MTLSNRQKSIQLSQASAIPHLAIEEVKELAAAAGEAARNVVAKERDPAPVLFTVGDRPAGADIPDHQVAGLAGLQPGVPSYRDSEAAPRRRRPRPAPQRAPGAAEGHRQPPGSSRAVGPHDC